MADNTIQSNERTAERDNATSHEELRDIFVAVTGSEEIIETQDRQPESRYISAEEQLAGPVTTMAKEDGLADTLADFVDTQEEE